MEQSEPARPGDDSTYREQLDEGHMRRRASFDEAADTYDGARPDYPEQLFDFILSSRGITTISLDGFLTNCCVCGLAMKRASMSSR